MGILEWLSPDNLAKIFLYDPEHPLLFHTGQFLVLFLIFMGIYLLLLGRKPMRTAWVFLFSLFFYYKSSGMYFLLLLFSTLLDYYLGFLIHREQDRRKARNYLIVSIVANLGILAVFKYTNFFVDTVNGIFSTPLGNLDIILPVGISFFTFQTMSYTIDIYRRKLEPVSNLLDFGFFVSFFPQLVAGPIVRAAQFLPQIRENIEISAEDLGRAFLLICSGLFKKAVISDYIGTNFVDGIFEVPTLHSGFENLMAVYGFALQIYCDFSGYSDMAIGIGLLLGFRLPINFNAPYQSASIQEFWRRWHISLSSWLRDYLYISMGGNRRGKSRTYINLLITMLLGGLWHGAAWRFVVWGALHGFALAIDRMLKHAKQWIRSKLSAGLDRLDEFMLSEEGQKSDNKFVHFLIQARWFMQGWFSLVLSVVLHLLSVIFTFHFVCFCWIFFRAESFELAYDMIENIYLNFTGGIMGEVVGQKQSVFLLMILGYLLHFIPDDIDNFIETHFIKSHFVIKSAVIALFMWVVFIVQSGLDNPQEFIYFQF